MPFSISTWFYIDTDGLLEALGSDVVHRCSKNSTYARRRFPVKIIYFNYEGIPFARCSASCKILPSWLYGLYIVVIASPIHIYVPLI